MRDKYLFFEKWGIISIYQNELSIDWKNLFPNYSRALKGKYKYKCTIIL